MKEFKTYNEQIEILKSRGLIINDEEFALKKSLTVIKRYLVEKDQKMILL